MLPRIVSFGNIVQLRITLRDIKPAIWRRVRVPSDASLGVLHEVIQAAFGWTNSHLHDFLIGEIRFGMVDAEDEIFSVDQNAAPLGAVALANAPIIYRYDFGDGWEHEVKVEGVTKGGDETIVCTGGARACPPEDCGGTGGYAQLLEVLSNKSHEDHAAMRRWVGRRFDPEKLDLAAVNRKLATMSRRMGRRRTVAGVAAKHR